jgi:hypothetical protein
VLNKQAANTNASIFCFEVTIYCNSGEQVNHYTSNVIHLEQNISVYQTKIKSKLKVIKKSIKTDHHQLVFNSLSAAICISTDCCFSELPVRNQSLLVSYKAGIIINISSKCNLFFLAALRHII